MTFESQHDVVVIYHKNCLDGIAAAWCAWKFYNKQVDLVPVSYGDNFEELFGVDFCKLINKQVFCLDFSFSYQITSHLLKICNPLVVLDHHDTAARNLNNLATPYYDLLAKQFDAGKLFEGAVVVNQSKSGATLAWDWFFGRGGLDTIPLGLLCVEDRDLWKWKIEQSKAWTATAFSYDFTVENFDMLINTPVADVLLEGKALLRAQKRNVQQLAKTASRFKIDEYDVPVVNCNIMFASDLGSVLAENEPFSITYSDSTNARLYSLRGRSGGVKVNEIAERFGGGGHPGAAGFRINFDDPRFAESHRFLISDLKEV